MNTQVPRLALSAMAALAACAAIAAVGDFNFPSRKPGLWELSRSASNPKYPPQVQRICLDEATDRMLYQIGEGAGRKLCSRFDVRTADGTVIVDSICTLGNSHVTSHNVFSFRGNAAYHEDLSAHYDPPLSGKIQDAHTTQDGKWVGECTADMKPGDIVSMPSPMMPIPLRMNIRDMLRDAH
jgi:hypothetical protein